jgi:regulatory protein
MEKSGKAPGDPFGTALRMLARRPYSVAELRRALERKFGTTESVAKTIARLRELGYLDDKQFAAQAASSLARNRSFGRYRIRRELKSRLVDYKHIEPALDQTFEETSERELLETVLDKKVRTLKPPFTRSRLYSLCQSLMRRGFRSDDIMKAVRSRPELKTVAEDVEDAEIESLSD